MMRVLLLLLLALDILRFKDRPGVSSSRDCSPALSRSHHHSIHDMSESMKGLGPGSSSVAHAEKLFSVPDDSYFVIVSSLAPILSINLSAVFFALLSKGDGNVHLSCDPDA